MDGEGRFLFVAAREKNGSRRIFRLPLAGTETVPTMAFSEDSLWILGDRHPATGSMQDGLMKRAWVIAGLLGLNSWDVGASLPETGRGFQGGVRVGGGDAAMRRIGVGRGSAIRRIRDRTPLEWAQMSPERARW